MLTGVERLIDLTGSQSSALTALSIEEVQASVKNSDLKKLASTDGHFSAVAREGRTVRLARTIGLPLRYFVAKMYHGPFLVVADRIDRIFEWCCEQQIGWQFDPAYTRMIPAHYLVEIDQIGCPDPAPRYHRFFNTKIAEGPVDIEESGWAYIQAAYQSLKHWVSSIPSNEPIAVAFSGGVDSASVLILAHQALKELDEKTDRLRAFTLDLGGGQDVVQAAAVARELGLERNWEAVRVPADRFNLEEAIDVIEDYHPLDVECAAAAICLLEAVRERHPNIKYLLDGDGGDENLKSYPLEDSDLTLSSVLRNPLLYQEGWGIETIKHSQTYSGGLSRGYARTYAPAQRFGFEAFSPYTTRSAIAAALAIPFEEVLGGDAERLATLKAEVVSAGIKSIAGVDLPVYPKRRFQDGAGGEAYRQWRVDKAWCKQVFLRQWAERLSNSAGPRRSGNEMTVPKEMVAAD